MNTKRIEQTKVKKLWDFPPLLDGKQGRVITKHFTNLSYTLNPNHYALLNFLIYQSLADNTVMYRKKLLTTFEKSVRMALNHYGGDNTLHLSLPKLRGNFIWLIENGLLLPTATPKQFLINPCLTYSKLYVKSEFYKVWVKQYNFYRMAKMDILISLVPDYITHVDNNFKSRGKRL